MTRHRTYLLSAGIAIAAISLMLAACGSSSSSANSSTSTPAATTAPATTAPATVDTETEKNTTAPAPATAAKVAVLMGKPSEFKLTATPTSAPGKVTFAVANEGNVVHEMVVVPAPNGAAGLKQPDGTASEAGSKGEVADLAPGKTARLTISLPAGKYVLLCNLPGHFASGMYADFTVS